MKYVNAEEVLPKNLIDEIRKFTQGTCVYIPSDPRCKKKWGESSGIRTSIQARNEIIRTKYRQGYRVDELSEEFFLSIHSIQKIVYKKIKDTC